MKINAVVLCTLIFTSISVFADENVTTSALKKIEVSGKFTDELMEGYSSLSFYGAELAGLYRVSESAPVSVGVILGYNKLSLSQSSGSGSISLGMSMGFSAISILPAAKLSLLDQSMIHPTLLGAAGLQVVSGSSTITFGGEGVSASQNQNAFKGIIEAGVDVDITPAVSVSASIRAGSSVRTSFWGPGLGALVRL